MKYKYARTKTELGREKDYIKELVEQKDCLLIPEWGVEDINADPEKIGLPGSPTKVKSVENIVLTVKEAKVLDASAGSIKEMMKDLIDAHIIG